MGVTGVGGVCDAWGSRVRRVNRSCRAHVVVGGSRSRRRMVGRLRRGVGGARGKSSE